MLKKRSDVYARCFHLMCSFVTPDLAGSTIPEQEYRFGSRVSNTLQRHVTITSRIEDSGSWHGDFETNFPHPQRSTL
jgi:hypothetical protein